jgi:hypothetical protein
VARLAIVDLLIEREDRTQRFAMSSTRVSLPVRAAPDSPRGDVRAYSMSMPRRSVSVPRTRRLRPYRRLTSGAAHS